MSSGHRFLAPEYCLTMLRNFLSLIALAIGIALCHSVVAQVPGKYFPLDHQRPPGVAAEWSALVQPGAYAQPQPVKVLLPEAGTVSFYQGAPQNEIRIAAPAQVSMLVGYVYRIKISNLPRRPGVELFPTIEVIDRLHPPVGATQQFPIPIEITEEEIEAALIDSLVTKVIYLEQPDFAAPVETTGIAPLEELPATDNLLAAADYRGRPLAILRIGGRIPDPNALQDQFYSSSPILFTGPVATPVAKDIPAQEDAEGVVRGF